MVLGYWDMAASLVTTGAVDADAIRAARRSHARGREGASVRSQRERGIGLSRSRRRNERRDE